jgi:peptidoglycan/xylan/chitin deacetylase (PgdA/CDA1 family)
MQCLHRILARNLPLGLLVVLAAVGFSVPAVRSQQVAIAFSPQPAPDDGTLRRIHVPILMYHRVSELPPDPDVYRLDLTVVPQVFRAHMQYLHDEGYNTISLYQLSDALLRGRPLPPQPVILTFDDGYIDHYVTVFSTLQEFGFVGTFFVITGYADANNPEYLNWSQIREMSDAGMSMEPHTRSHLGLVGRDRDFLTYEVLGSFESLAAHTGRTPRMFAYPGGDYDDAALDMLESVYCWRAVTTQRGALHTTGNYLEVPRVRVSGDTGVVGLAHLLQTS